MTMTIPDTVLRLQQRGFVTDEAIASVGRERAISAYFQHLAQDAVQEIVSKFTCTEEAVQEVKGVAIRLDVCAPPLDDLKSIIRAYLESTL